MTDRTEYYKSKNYKFIHEKDVEDGGDKFLLNENQLKIDEDNGEKNIDIEEFKKRIAQKVMSFVNRSFDNIIILLGAGASVIENEVNVNDEKLKSGVTVSKIADRVYEKLEIVGQDDISTEESKKSPYTLKGMMKKISYPIPDPFLIENGELNKKFNLEDFLSVLLTYEKFVPRDEKDKYGNTVDMIKSVIIDSTSYDYSNASFKHEKFLKAISNYLHKDSKLQIVTTNYDTLIEDVADKMQWTIFDGFTFSQHPQFDSDLFNWNLVKQVPNVQSNENIYKENVANLFKLHGSVTWQESSNGVSRGSKGSVREPLMIFPSSDKYAQSYQEPYFELFSKFQELLKQPNTLLITSGFSFSDNHIFRMISSSMRTNNSLSVLVTDYSIDRKTGDNWNQLEKLMDAYYDVAFLKASMNDDLADYFEADIDEN